MKPTTRKPRVKKAKAPRTTFVERGELMIPTDMLVVPSEATAVPELPPEDADALLASIRENGILVPLRVYLQGTAYAILSGRHRFGCAQTLGMGSVPCVVVPKPADVPREMIEEAIHGRKLPRAGAAALLLDVIPALIDRMGKFGDPSKGGNLNRVTPNGQPLVHWQQKGDDEPTITATAQRFGIHKTYFQAMIAARAECRGEEDWAKLKALVCIEPMAPSRVMSALRGIQTGSQPGVCGKSEINLNKVSIRAKDHFGTMLRHWDKIDDVVQVKFCESVSDFLTDAPFMLREYVLKAVRIWEKGESTIRKERES
jgi:hypothetical protein